MANCVEDVPCLFLKSGNFDSLTQQLLKFHSVSETGMWLLGTRKAERKRVKKKEKEKKGKEGQDFLCS